MRTLGTQNDDPLRMMSFSLNMELVIIFSKKLFQSKQGEVDRAVMDAIDLGYRHIDTAYFYENEQEVGKAIKAKIDDGTVKREDLFITTKVRIILMNHIKKSMLKNMYFSAME